MPLWTDALNARPDWSRPELLARFRAHVPEVIQGMPPERPPLFSPRQGWEPLCRFLDRPAPEDPFPRTSAREEFFARVDVIE